MTIKWTQELVDKFCDALVSGLSMRAAADEIGVDAASIYRKMYRDQAFAATIARAREAQQDAEVERMIELADTADAENYNAVKLQIWARQWRAGKLAQRKYGDKQTVEMTVTSGLSDRMARLKQKKDGK